jgi:hypothetical protein
VIPHSGRWPNQILNSGRSVQAPVKGVLLGQREVGIDKIAHRAGVKPETVQPPFSARVNEPVSRQRLQRRQPLVEEKEASRLSLCHPRFGKISRRLL